MGIKGNKGEWSEIYALFKMLGDGKVHAGDPEMNKLELYYPIIKVIREEAQRYEYLPDVKNHIVLVNEEGVELVRIPMQSFLDESKYLLESIKSEKATTFEVQRTEAFMNQVKCTKLKAPSKDKADIHIVIHDLRTSMSHLLGFSIKSQLGSASTLLNAGNPTNITYIVKGATLSDGDIENINSIPDHLSRMQNLIDRGCELEYSDIEHHTFKNNLLFLDTCMPEFIAKCLEVGSMPDSGSSIAEVVNNVATINPFNFTGNDVLSFYKHKMKVLLLDVALGMTPAKEWIGRYDANGGYLVVRKDGEIVCYHFYNRNDVEDYLYNNTRFEQASRSRYGFGSLYRGEDGLVKVKLNLQIRFKK